jgi:hypothetical protein
LGLAGKQRLVAGQFFGLRQLRYQLVHLSPAFAAKLKIVATTLRLRIYSPGRAKIRH